MCEAQDQLQRMEQKIRTLTGRISRRKRTKGVYGDVLGMLQGVVSALETRLGNPFYHNGPPTDRLQNETTVGDVRSWLGNLPDNTPVRVKVFDDAADLVLLPGSEGLLIQALTHTNPRPDQAIIEVHPPLLND